MTDSTLWLFGKLQIINIKPFSVDSDRTGGFTAATAPGVSSASGSALLTAAGRALPLRLPLFFVGDCGALRKVEGTGVAIWKLSGASMSGALLRRAGDHAS